MSAARFSQIFLSSQFVVWVIYGVLSGMGHWSAGVAFGLVASVFLLSLEATRHIKVKLMDWVLLGYFVLATIATFLVRSAGFPTYSSVVIWVLYAGVAWASIAFAAPFTLQYARESAPPDRWQSPGFLHANRVITMFWALAFLANVVLVTIALTPRYNSLWIAVVAPILTMVIASIFTSRYTRMVRERARQA